MGRKGGTHAPPKGGIPFRLKGAASPFPTSISRLEASSQAHLHVRFGHPMDFEEEMEGPGPEGGYEEGFPEGFDEASGAYEGEGGYDESEEEEELDEGDYPTAAEFGNGMEDGVDGDDMFEEAMAAVDASLSEEPDQKATYGRGAVDLDDFDPYDIRAQERLELQRKSAERLAELRQEASQYLEKFYSKRDEAVQKVAEENRVADQKALEAIVDQSKTGWEKTISMINFRTDNKPKKGPADEDKKAVDTSKYKKLLFKLRERETGEAEE